MLHLRILLITIFLPFNNLYSQNSDLIVINCFGVEFHECDTTFYKFDNLGRFIANYNNHDTISTSQYLEYKDSLIVKTYYFNSIGIKKYDSFGKLLEIRSYKSDSTNFENNKNSVSWKLQAVWEFKNDSLGNNREIKGIKYDNINISNDGITYLFYDRNSRLVMTKFIGDHCNDFSPKEKICNITTYEYNPVINTRKSIGSYSILEEIDSLNSIGNKFYLKETYISRYENKYVDDSLIIAIEPSALDWQGKSHQDTLLSISEFFYDKKNRIIRITRSDKDFKWDTITSFIYKSDINIKAPEEVFEDYFRGRW